MSRENRPSILEVGVDRIPPPGATRQEIEAIYDSVGKNKGEAVNDNSLVGKNENKTEIKKQDPDQEKVQTLIANDLNKAVIQFSIEKNGRQPSVPEAKGLVRVLEATINKQENKVTDKVYLEKLAQSGSTTYDTGRKIKIKTVDGDEAVFKLVLKTDTGVFQLRGELKDDILTKGGQFAESLKD